MNTSCRFLIHITPVRPAPAFVAAPFTKTCGRRGSGFEVAGEAVAPSRLFWAGRPSPVQPRGGAGGPSPPPSAPPLRQAPPQLLSRMEKRRGASPFSLCLHAPPYRGGSAVRSTATLEFKRQDRGLSACQDSLDRPRHTPVPTLQMGTLSLQRRRALQRPADCLRIPVTARGIPDPCESFVGREEGARRLGQIPGRRGAPGVLWGVCGTAIRARRR